MAHSPSTAAPDDGLVLADLIGSGAIASVARVEDRVRGGVYAGKILHDRHLRDEAASRRFIREAELTTRLVHENLVRVWGTRQISGKTVLLMELVDGPTLADHLARRGALPEPELIAIARGIADGLSYAHAAGVIHRDLKPANILMTSQGVPKIADFGMARASSFASADKGALTVLGTPHYMAPECLEPLAVDPRTDLYALGCMIHEMATGAPPYGGATPMAVLQAHGNAPIPELPSHYSEGLRRIVARLLAKAPGDRPQSAAAVVEALDRTTTTALALAQPGAIARARAESAAEGHCAQCGEKVLRELRVCFGCGLAQVIVEPGGHTVFVTGPGNAPQKLDSELRDRLVRWLRSNATVGLEAALLEANIPRLPFVLVTGVSEASGRTFVSSLSCLGVHAESVRGGRRSHRSMLKKSGVLAGRASMVSVAILGTPLMISPFLGMFTVPLLAVVLPVIFGVTHVQTSRTYVNRVSVPPSALPLRLQQQLTQLYTVVGQIVERRHREALRAVVNRAVALCRDTADAPDREGLQEEMLQAIGLAAQACLRMDELDRTMAQPGFDPADPAHRQSMHERDMWSARLLGLTATLDSLAARRASAEARLRTNDEDLDALHAMVEALEEVQHQ